jgi:hypothetical protein
MSIKQVLLEGAALRRMTKTILDQQVHFIEPTALQRFEYIARRAKDKAAGIAYIIEMCVIDEEGKRLFSAEEALEIAQGSERVAVPLVAAIMLEEDEKEVKNDSAQTDASSSS